MVYCSIVPITPSISIVLLFVTQWSIVLMFYCFTHNGSIVLLFIVLLFYCLKDNGPIVPIVLLLY